MPSTRNQVYLTEKKRRRIDELASDRGLSLAEVVRRALDAYLDEEHPDPERLSQQHSQRHLIPLRRAETDGTVADVLVDTDVFMDGHSSVEERPVSARR